MVELLIPIAVALVLILVAWNVFKGVVKTVALGVIVVLAAVFVFRMGGLG